MTESEVSTSDWHDFRYEQAAAHFAPKCNTPWLQMSDIMFCSYCENQGYVIKKGSEND